MPCPADAGALLNNDEVVALVALNEVDCHAHTRDTGSNDNDCSVSVVFIPDRNLRPWLRATHYDRCSYL